MALPKFVTQSWWSACDLRQRCRQHCELGARFFAQFVACVYLRPCASFRTHVAVFEMCLDSFPLVVLEVMEFEITAPLFKTNPLLFAKLMAALTNFEADVRLRVALRAAFLPRLAHRLLLRHRHLGGASSSKSNKPRLIGLLNGTLGMNASQRVCRLSANGANVLRRRR